MKLALVERILCRFFLLRPLHGIQSNTITPEKVRARGITTVHVLSTKVGIRDLICNLDVSGLKILQFKWWNARNYWILVAALLSLQRWSFSNSDDDSSKQQLQLMERNGPTIISKIEGSQWNYCKWILTSNMKYWLTFSIFLQQYSLMA